MSAMAAVSVMHEQVHERARGEEQERQRAEYMRGVLGNQEERADRQEPAEHQSERRSPPRRFNLISHRLGFQFCCYWSLLINGVPPFECIDPHQLESWGRGGGGFKCAPAGSRDLSKRRDRIGTVAAVLF